MKTLKLIVLLLALIASVGLAQAQNSGVNDLPAPSLVPCSGVDAAASNWTCGAKQFFELVNRVIKFCIFYLAVPLATVGIAYSGINMVFHPDNPGTRKEAIGTIKMILIGLIWVLGAYLIVTTLINYIIKPGAIKNVIE